MDIYLSKRWKEYCRYFPILCLIEIKSLDSDQTWNRIRNAAAQFDMSFICYEGNNLEEDLKKISQFLGEEKIANVGMIDMSEKSSLSDVERVRELVRNNFNKSHIIFAKENKPINQNIRWKLYDIISRLRIPDRQELFLNENLDSLSVGWSYFVFCTPE